MDTNDTANHTTPETNSRAEERRPEATCSPVCQNCGQPLSAKLIAYGLVRLRKRPTRCGICALNALEKFLNEEEENSVDQRQN